MKIVCNLCGAFSEPYGVSTTYCKPCKVQKNREANARMRERLGEEEFRRRGRAAARKYRHANPARRLWRSAKGRAALSGTEFTIGLSDIVIPEFCPVLGMKLVQGDARSKDAAPSLDRIDNSRGYVPGNVVVVSWRANRIKTDATVEELEKILNFYGGQKWRA